MATAAKALDAANTNLNTTEAGLDKIVDAARQNQTTHDTAYQSALNLYNDAVGQHEKAQNQYNLDEGSLDNIQKECQQPIHPTNCPTLISNAKKQIATDESNLENTQEAIGVAQKSLNSVRRAPRLPITSALRRCAPARRSLGGAARADQSRARRGHRALLGGRERQVRHGRGAGGGDQAGHHEPAAGS